MVDNDRWLLNAGGHLNRLDCNSIDAVNKSILAN